MATIQNNAPPARCLDLTRLVSRIGKGQLTGVDRVEMEYLSCLVGDPVPLFGLMKHRRRFYLLDETATKNLLSWFESGNLWSSRIGGQPHRIRRFLASRFLARQIRKRSTFTANAKTLGQVLRTKLPSGTNYLNVGHANISDETFHSVGKVANFRISVLLHDCIPIDYPQYQRAGTPERFRKMLATISKYADLIIYNSKDSQTTTELHLADFGRVPHSIVALLGVRAIKPENPEVQPAKIAKPYFVVVGTIEPRKNHALLLDIWEGFAKEPNAPELVIVGKRGWENQTVFKRLENSPANVAELNNVSDDALYGLLKNCAGMLFPSFAEGFGLPPAEAAMMGVPVVCGDLPVYREFLGDYPIYADVGDMYLWRTAIRSLVNCSPDDDNRASKSKLQVALPTWEDHFNLVLKLT